MVLNIALEKMHTGGYLIKIRMDRTHMLAFKRQTFLDFHVVDGPVSHSVLPSGATKRATCHVPLF